MLIKNRQIKYCICLQTSESANNALRQVNLLEYSNVYFFYSKLNVHCKCT